MTDPLVELEQTRLQVDPGGQVSVRVTVRNLGHIIEGFRLDVLGAGVSEWAEVSPSELRVDVEQEASAVVIFTPPTGSSMPTGSFAFGVKATSLVDPSSSAVAEGDIDVGRVFGLTSKLTPVTSSGRWRGNHRVEFSNWGNSPVTVRLSASDPDERLGFLVVPDTLAVPLGASASAQVKVRTRKPFLRGEPVRLPFQVVGEPYEESRVARGDGSSSEPQRQVLDGALMQKPIIGRAVVRAAGLVLGAGAVIAVLAATGAIGGDKQPAAGPVTVTTPTTGPASTTDTSGAPTTPVTSATPPTTPTAPTTPTTPTEPSTPTTPTSPTSPTTPTAPPGSTPVSGDWIIFVDQTEVQSEIATKIAQWTSRGFGEAGSIADWRVQGSTLIYANFGSQSDMQAYCDSTVKGMPIGNVPHPCLVNTDIIQVP